MTLENHDTGTVVLDEQSARRSANAPRWWAYGLLFSLVWIGTDLLFPERAYCRDDVWDIVSFFKNLDTNTIIWVIFGWGIGFGYGCTRTKIIGPMYVGCSIGFGAISLPTFYLLLLILQADFSSIYSTACRSLTGTIVGGFNALPFVLADWLTSKFMMGTRRQIALRILLVLIPAVVLALLVGSGIGIGICLFE